MADIHQEFSSISGRLETYQKEQEQASLRQQRALHQIRSMIEKESQEIVKSPQVFGQSTPSVSVPSTPAVPLAQNSPIDSSGTVSTPENTSSSSKNELFHKAVEKYNQKQFTSAADEFLQAYSSASEDELRARCLFWTGECYYQIRQWDYAIQYYVLLQSQHPGDPIVATALLKEGYAYINKGKIPEGKKRFRQLIDKYPNSNEAILAREHLEELGLSLAKPLL